MAFLVWLAGPLVRLASWWRSATAHEQWLTLFAGACLVLAAWVDATGWRYARRHGRRLDDAEALPPLRPWPRGLALRHVLGLAAVTILRPEVDVAGAADAARRAWLDGTFRLTRETPTLSPLRLVALALIDLFGADLVPTPAAWRRHDLARQDYQAVWCAARRAGDACDPDGAHAEAFAARWQDERAATLDALESQALRGADLRRADLGQALLVGLALERARLAAANLWRTNLAGAVIGQANLEGSNLGGANLAGADLRGGEGAEHRANCVLGAQRR